MQVELLQKQAVDIKASVQNRLGMVLSAPKWSAGGAISLVVAEDGLSGVVSSDEAVGIGELVLSHEGLEPLVIGFNVMPLPAVKIAAEVGQPRDI